MVNRSNWSCEAGYCKLHCSSLYVFTPSEKLTLRAKKKKKIRKIQNTCTGEADKLYTS